MSVLSVAGQSRGSGPQALAPRTAAQQAWAPRPGAQQAFAPRAAAQQAGAPLGVMRQNGMRWNGALWNGAPWVPRAGRVRPGPGVRLTPRGRRVIAGFAVAVAVTAAAACWLAAAAVAQAANHGARPGAVYRSMTAVAVQPGQTLWSIALRAEPAADPRVVVSQIVEFNALASDVVVPGERLWVPRS
jgi:hypothetical protein